MTNPFLPLDANDLRQRGWDECDFVLITGDAYVDHPSFGAAIISRVLEAEGFRVGIIPQPRCEDPEAFRVLGRPRLGFLITAGNLDSMVAHYTANKKKRSDDAFSPGGRTGLRPDRALIVYTSAARRAFKDVPVILGGLEASLRRFSHYDYWSNKIRRSVLLDAKADLAVYGMGERAIIDLAHRLDQGAGIFDLTDIPGTIYRTTDIREKKTTDLPSFEEVSSDPGKFAESVARRYRLTSFSRPVSLRETCGDFSIIQNPPAPPLSPEEMDRVYELPYTRRSHPRYEAEGGVPALTEVEFSITRNRGCYGGCSFCSLTYHQGQTVTTRSDESVLKEAELLTALPHFKGYIHDVGGPTANFTGPACAKQGNKGACTEKNCLTPNVCSNLDISSRQLIELLRKIRALPKVKKVFIRSGIRFDYLMAEKNQPFLEELCLHHISGQLKVAPEHASDKVLKLMNKPKNAVYKRFKQAYEAKNKKLGFKQYLVPYLISAHPGSGLREAAELAEFLKESGFVPDQIQDFYPTPGTLSTCMYYTGVHPLTGEKVFVERTEQGRRMQRALIQFNKPYNRSLAEKALRKAGRTDLIPILLGSGFRPHSGHSSRKNVKKKKR